MHRKVHFRSILVLFLVVLMTITLTGCLRGVISFENMTLTIVEETSEEASEDYKPLAVKHTRIANEGLNLSPGLEWKDVPENTQSFALIVDDATTQLDTEKVMWVMYNIPASTRSLPEGMTTEQLPAGAVQGINSFGNKQYDGPLPTEEWMDDGDHRIYFKLYALDAKLTLSGNVTKEVLVSEVLKHILAEGSFYREIGYIPPVTETPEG